MNNRHLFYNNKIPPLVICTVLLLSSCANTDFSYVFKSPEQKEALAHESPLFWDDTTPINDNEGLYILHNVAFEGNPYNNIISFGDNILMVGQGSYSTSIVDVEDTDIEYSFDVYDPWMNELTASLTHSETNCDYYEVIEDNLWLIDSATGNANVYDQDLNFVREDTYDGVIFGDSVPNPAGYYNVSQICSSNDNTYALVSGISPDSWRYEVSSIKLETNEIVSSYEGEYFSISCVNDNGFVGLTDSLNNIWNYHTTTGTDTYFNTPEVHDIAFTKDNSVLIRHNNYIPQSEDGQISSVCYYQYSPDKNVTAAFEYKLDAASQEDTKFCSTDSVYLEDANCLMLLLYTSQCNPEILVWSLDEASNTTNTSFYSASSNDELIELLKSDDLYTSSYPDDYGAENTLIPDTQAYDWGELSDIQSRCNEIESNYGISIYFGPEVPTLIDYYTVKQCTSHDELSDSLDALEKVFSYFPENFFNQLSYGSTRGLRIYLAGKLHSSNEELVNEASGFVSTINNYSTMVLDCSYSWDWSYILSHELSHLIDQRLEFIHDCNPESLFSEDVWKTFNPDDFSYNDTYTTYSEGKLPQKLSKYFIDSYGTTYATEDRAEIFGSAMDTYINGSTDYSRFEASSPIAQKLSYYNSCIRDGFNTTGWNEVLPWEQVLQ